MATNSHTVQAKVLRRMASEATDPAIREEYLKLADALMQITDQDPAAVELDALAEHMVGNIKKAL